VGPICRPEETYRVCVYVCVIKSDKVHKIPTLPLQCDGRKRSEWERNTKGRINVTHIKDFSATNRGSVLVWNHRRSVGVSVMMSNLTPVTYAWEKPAASVVSAELHNGITGLQGVTSQKTVAFTVTAFRTCLICEIITHSLKISWIHHTPFRGHQSVRGHTVMHVQHAMAFQLNTVCPL